jgi:DNA-binding Xre family transcriptional regulator
MAVHWHLRSYLATKHGIYTARALQRKITETTGTIISLQNLCNYLNVKPSLLRLDTVELFCTALQCELSEFCRVSPGKPRRAQGGPKKLSYKNAPLSKRSVHQFPDPKEY